MKTAKSFKCHVYENNDEHHDDDDDDDDGLTILKRQDENDDVHHENKNDAEDDNDGLTTSPSLPERSLSMCPKEEQQEVYQYDDCEPNSLAIF